MISKLRVQNFRRHRDFTAEFSPDTTVITGSNGSGKTSLIEAIYVALRGRSWRSNFSEITRDGANWWRVDIWFDDGSTRTVKFDNGIKTFIIDEQKFSRLPAKFKLPVVLFEPGDLNLLYGSPARRRDYFDNFIGEIEPSHLTNLHKFERTLKQRNNLLKQGARPDSLFVWDIQFADLGEKIIAARMNWIGQIADQIAGEYQKISGKDDKIELIYKPTERTRQQILDKLKSEEIANLPFTACGPQQHDIHFKIRGHSAKTAASRGENRTIIFAIISIVSNILKIFFQSSPVLLLDDIDSELDIKHQDGLYRNISRQNRRQLITTTINKPLKSNMRRINLTK
jgi:DNA replication and repair protein RecF